MKHPAAIDSRGWRLSGRAAFELAQLLGDPEYDGRPRAELGLAEDAHRRIPRHAVASKSVAPFRTVRHHNPRRLSQRAAQLYQRGVYAEHEIQRAHECCEAGILSAHMRQRHLLRCRRRAAKGFELAVLSRLAQLRSARVQPSQQLRKITTERQADASHNIQTA